MEKPDESPPLPLSMAADDYERASKFLDRVEEVENRRVLVEILEVLRSIDDKLASVLRRERR